MKFSTVFQGHFLDEVNLTGGTPLVEWVEWVECLGVTGTLGVIPLSVIGWGALVEMIGSVDILILLPLSLVARWCHTPHWCNRQC